MRNNITSIPKNTAKTWIRLTYPVNDQVYELLKVTKTPVFLAVAPVTFVPQGVN